MTSQLQTVFLWVGAVAVIILATIFYQPAAAKTGSLLVWTKNRVYVMDIDLLRLRRVGPAAAGERITPAPGCLGQTETPCWVVVGKRLYEVSLDSSQASTARQLPGAGAEWLDMAVSWSPDGLHLAYAVRSDREDEAELRLVDVTTLAVKVIIPDVDPAVAAAWTGACAGGLNGADCRIAYKTTATAPLQLAALEPATHQAQTWPVAETEITALRWTADNQLLYSQPARHFHYAETQTPAYSLPPGGQLANLTPRGTYTMYYQPFKLRDCVTETGEDCLHLGVWLTKNGESTAQPELIYHLDLDQARSGGLNFVPIWTTAEQAAVFFQNGQLIHYDVAAQEATIWYKGVRGKLRSEPIFSPSGKAVAFVDNQGQGYSEYRLVVVDPKLQPIEHIIKTESGFRLLAWLPW